MTLTTIDSVSLTQHQKELLLRILISPTEHVAYEETSENIKLKFAAEMLKDLGALNVDEDSASITDRGREILKDEALIDDSEQITRDGLEILDHAGIEVPQNQKSPDAGKESEIDQDVESQQDPDDEQQ